MGVGLSESCYQLALAHELSIRSIPFERELQVEAIYKGIRVGSTRLDFLIDGKLVVELKSAERIHEAHTAQALTYCKLTGCRLGLLINFGSAVLLRGIKRVINS